MLVRLSLNNVLSKWVQTWRVGVSIVSDRSPHAWTYLQHLIAFTHRLFLFFFLFQFPFHLNTDHSRHLLEQILDFLDDGWWDDPVPFHSLHITLHVNVLTTITSSQFDIQQDFRHLLSFLIPTLEIEFEVVIQQWLRASHLVGENYWTYYMFNSIELRFFH